MLSRSIPRSSAARGKAQSGVVLIIVLIVLVAMTLAGIAMVRSVDTTTLIAGNMAFQQAATHSGDVGIETAAKWLNDNAAGTLLDNDDSTNGYRANGLTFGPNVAASPPQTWNDFWVNSYVGRPPVQIPGPDASGNRISYVIDRLCTNAGSATSGGGCVDSTAIAPPSGNSEEAGEKQLNAASGVYYRITVRVDGPRNSVSYVQAVVSI